MKYKLLTKEPIVIHENPDDYIETGFVYEEVDERGNTVLVKEKRHKDLYKPRSFCYKMRRAEQYNPVSNKGKPSSLTVKMKKFTGKIEW